VITQYVVALVYPAGVYPAGYILGMADTYDEAVELRTHKGVIAAVQLGMVELSITPDDDPKYSSTRLNRKSDDGLPNMQ